MRVTAKGFKATRLVLDVTKPHSYAQYRPKQGDVIYYQVQQVVTTSILSSGFHVVSSVYIGLVWSDTQYSLLWKAFTGNTLTVAHDLRDMQQVFIKKDVSKMNLIIPSFYFPSEPFTCVPMPCKVETFGKNSGFNINKLDVIPSSKLPPSRKVIP